MDVPIDFVIRSSSAIDPRRSAHMPSGDWPLRCAASKTGRVASWCDWAISMGRGEASTPVARSR